MFQKILSTRTLRRFSVGNFPQWYYWHTFWSFMSRFSTSRCTPRKKTETMNHHRWQRHYFQWIWAPSMVTIVSDIRDVERMIMTCLNETKPQTRLHLTPNGQTPLLGRLGDLWLVILNPVVGFDWRFAPNVAAENMSEKAPHRSHRMRRFYVTSAWHLWMFPGAL